MKFEFDPAKSASNQIKHGLDFVQAQRLWQERRIEIPANLIPGEMRYAVLGKIGGVPHTLIITYRAGAIRLISARPSSKPEIAIYENQISQS